MPPSHEVRTRPGNVAHLEPGVPVGLGYDGGVGAWKAAIEPHPGSPVPAHERGHPSARPRVRGRFARPDLRAAYDTRIVVRDLDAELRFREVGEPSVELIGKAKGFGVVAHEPLVPLIRGDPRQASATGCASTSTWRRG